MIDAIRLRLSSLVLLNTMRGEFDENRVVLSEGGGCPNNDGDCHKKRSSSGEVAGYVKAEPMPRERTPPIKLSSKVDQTLSWSGCAGFCASCRMPADHCHWPDTMNYNSIVCFRIDEDIDKRISRILGPKYATRSRFIRAAIERLLLQESEERLRAAEAAIRWG